MRICRATPQPARSRCRHRSSRRLGPEKSASWRYQDIDRWTTTGRGEVVGIPRTVEEETWGRDQNLQVQKEVKKGGRSRTRHCTDPIAAGSGVHDRCHEGKTAPQGSLGRCQLTTPHAALYFRRGILEIFSLLELVTNIHSTEYIGTSIDTTEHRTTDSRPRQPDWHPSPTSLLSRPTSATHLTSELAPLPAPPQPWSGPFVHDYRRDLGLDTPRLVTANHRLRDARS